MPELPEIAVLARDMDRDLARREIAAVEVLQPKCLNVPPAEFESRLKGASITRVHAHGKWLKLETSRTWLFINLGMGGEVLLVDRTRLPEHWRLAFDLSDGACLVVNFWWFGYVHVSPDPADHPMVGRLGPHAIDVTLPQFEALLRGRRGSIKAFLLDQGNIAGIGNVYVQDPLFMARLHPLRGIATLSSEEIAALWHALRTTLQQSIDLGGAAFEVNLHGEHGRWGREHFLVAYREGKPCPVCATPLEKIRTGSTAGYICPACQRLPA
ncbi:MAG TPA: DNA-formamidopyrimidine glycosylase family protein [Anaerolineae bacterium]|nr:DNA-formamidopyrimidine glycosylase family protein [Anaerolineae bacterium]